MKLYIQGIKRKKMKPIMDFHEPEKQKPLYLLSSNNWNYKHTRGLPVKRESK